MQQSQNIKATLGGRAAAVADPVSGEIISSWVTIPSRVVGFNVNYVTQFLINNNISPPAPRKKSGAPQGEAVATRLVPHRHHPHHHDHKHHESKRLNHRLQSQLLSLQSKFKMSPMRIETVAKNISLDIMRQTTAHEIGHALGLRHNFACSTQTDINIDNYDDIVADYAQTGKVPADLNISACVMDYHDPMIDALIGASIRLKRPALNYDKDAILHLYATETTPKPTFSSPFCSDHDLGRYDDCEKFDAFSNPSAWRSHLITQFVRNQPVSIMQSYQDINSSIESLAAAGKKLDPVEYIRQAPLSPAGDAIHISLMWEELLDSISSRARFVQVKDQFYSLSHMNVEEYFERTDEFVSKNIEELGGLSQILFDHLTPIDDDDNDGAGTLQYTSTMEKIFDNLLQERKSPSVSDDVPFPFPFNDDDTAPEPESDGDGILVEQQQEAIQQKLSRYLQLFEKELLLRSIQVLKLQRFNLKDESILDGKSHPLLKEFLFEKSSDKIDSFNGTDFFSPSYFEYSERQPLSRSSSWKIAR